MPVKIHDKMYATVAERVKVFRDSESTYQEWFIHTKLVFHDDTRVVFKATVGFYLDHQEDNKYTWTEKHVIGSGYAEEVRNASAINRTSAMEVCETSAIGRALASLGLSGSDEYASANEVEHAIEKGAQARATRHFDTMDGVI